jgi:hypothetical protein
MTTRARSHRWSGSVVALGLAVAMTACASSSANPNGVASLNGSGNTSADDGASTATTQLSAQQKEDELLKYVQCLRQNGLPDIPDPQFDSNGNLQFGRGAGGFGGGGRGAGAAGAAGGASPSSSIDPQALRSAFDDARKTCGDPPRGALPQFSADDRQKLQDAALAFAKCMRDKGFDVPDPDFSQIGQGGQDGGGGLGRGAPGGNGQGLGRAGGQGNGGDQGGGRGLFGNLDRNDPKVQAAVQDCRSNLTGLPGGIGGGGNGNAGGGSGGSTNGAAANG